jgi:hypothetical protein
LRAEPERLISLLGTKIGADLAFELQLSCDPRQLAGGHQQGAGNGRRRVISDRGRRWRQLDAQCPQALFRRLAVEGTG